MTGATGLSASAATAKELCPVCMAEMHERREYGRMVWECSRSHFKKVAHYLDIQDELDGVQEQAYA